MDIPSPTTLILDLRDRMARIETKLDGHHEAHVIIDKAFENVEKRFIAVEARQDAHAALIADARSEMAVSKARVATLAAVASGLIAVVTFAAEHLWSLLNLA